MQGNIRNIPICTTLAGRSTKVNALKNIESACEKEAQAFLINMATNLTEDEMMMLYLYIPICEMMVIKTSEQLCDTCRDLRISEYKKATRYLHDVNVQYYKNMQKASNSSLMLISKATEMLQESMERHMPIFYFTILNEVKKQNPNVKHEEVVVYAWFIMIFSKFLDNYREKLNKLTKEKCGITTDCYIKNDYICHVEMVVKKLLDDTDVQFTQNIELATRIYNNNLESLKLEDKVRNQIRKEIVLLKQKLEN